VYEPIETLFQSSSCEYGIIELFGQSASVARCNEFGEITQTWRKETKLQKNHHRGGQSQNRIARLRLESIHNYLKMVSEQATRMFTCEGRPRIQALLIVGNSVKKEQIKEYVPLKVPMTIQTMEEYNKAQIKKAIDTMIGTRITNQNAIYAEELQQLLQTQVDKLTFGKEETMEAWTKRELERVYVSENMEGATKCKVCIVSEALLKQYGGMVGVMYVNRV
jgi:peptide subunit release factor 1 (eRF1)